MLKSIKTLMIKAVEVQETAQARQEKTMFLSLGDHSCFTAFITERVRERGERWREREGGEMEREGGEMERRGIDGERGGRDEGGRTINKYTTIEKFGVT